MEGDFLSQIERVAASDIDMLILREKDLTEAAYTELAKQVLAVCRKQKKRCILHTYPDAVRSLHADGIHFPLPVLLDYKKQHGDLKAEEFGEIGTSVHSVEEAMQAVEAGATYVTAGHVFVTDCKKGVPARGLDFLAQVCRAVEIPVYAIGGIDEGNAVSCIQAGAAGVCMMSTLMKG